MTTSILCYPNLDRVINCYSSYLQFFNSLPKLALSIEASNQSLMFFHCLISHKNSATLVEFPLLFCSLPIIWLLSLQIQKAPLQYKVLSPFPFIKSVIDNEEEKETTINIWLKQKESNTDNFGKDWLCHGITNHFWNHNEQVIDYRYCKLLRTWQGTRHLASKPSSKSCTTSKLSSSIKGLFKCGVGTLTQLLAASSTQLFQQILLDD